MYAYFAKRLTIILFTFLFYICLLPVTWGQVDSLDNFHSIFKELRRDSLLKLTIETDFKLLIKKKYEENYQPATLRMSDKSGNPISYETKLRTRGNIRKKICFYPPIKLKFSKQWLAENGMDSIYNDLKLVVGCKRGTSYADLVLKEYLAYQLYAALTGYSFRTQLAEITIMDIGDNRKPYTTYAFIIENQDEMAHRFNGRCTKPKRMSLRGVWKEQMALMSMFQYMIGNTDWSLPNSHNIRFVGSKNVGKAIPIAYDFDYSGLVNAPYAVHRESIGIENIQERYFMGLCENKEGFDKAVPIFLEKKDTFYKIVDEFTILNEGDRKAIKAYFDDFFGIIESQRAYKRQILSNCRS